MKKTFEILYEDDHLVVINKPALLLTIPDRFQPEKANLYHLLQKQYGQIWVVHRLDKETSGAICFAKNEMAHKELSQQFEGRQTKKIYHALVKGKVNPPMGQIDKPIAAGKRGKMLVARQGKEALSLYEVVQSFKRFSWVKVEIKTGRTHQIRVHFQAIGHPLAVDSLYGGKSSFFLSEIKTKKFKTGKDKEERPLLSRLSLHASQLSLDHPETGERLLFEAPLPKDLRACLNQLQKWG